jgi:hypothetical protein
VTPTEAEGKSGSGSDPAAAARWSALKVTLKAMLRDDAKFCEADDDCDDLDDDDLLLIAKSTLINYTRMKMMQSRDLRRSVGNAAAEMNTAIRRYSAPYNKAMSNAAKRSPALPDVSKLSSLQIFKVGVAIKSEQPGVKVQEVRIFSSTLDFCQG